MGAFSTSQLHELILIDVYSILLLVSHHPDDHAFMTISDRGRNLTLVRFTSCSMLDVDDLDGQRYLGQIDISAGLRSVQFSGRMNWMVSDMYLWQGPMFQPAYVLLSAQSC